MSRFFVSDVPPEVLRGEGPACTCNLCLQPCDAKACKVAIVADAIDDTHVTILICDSCVRGTFVERNPGLLRAPGPHRNTVLSFMLHEIEHRHL